MAPETLTDPTHALGRLLALGEPLERGSKRQEGPFKVHEAGLADASGDEEELGRSLRGRRQLGLGLGQAQRVVATAKLGVGDPQVMGSRQ